MTDLDFSDEDTTIDITDEGEEGTINPIDEDILAQHVPLFVIINNIKSSLESGEELDSLLIKEALKLHEIDDVGMVLSMKDGPSSVNNEILVKILNSMNPRVEGILKDLVANMKRDVDMLIETSKDINLTMGADVGDLNMFIQNKICMMIDDDMVSKDLLEQTPRGAYAILNKLQIFSGEMESLCATIENELNMGDSPIREVMSYIDLLYGEFVNRVNQLHEWRTMLADMDGTVEDGCKLVELRKDIYLAKVTIEQGAPLFRNKRIFNAMNSLFREKLG